MKKAILCLLLLCSVVACATVTTPTFSVSFVCVGGFGPFPFTFPISDPTAMAVILNGVLLIPSDYTIMPVNNNYNNGGSVTLGGGFPCVASQILVLTRITPVTQTVSFYDNMPIPMKTFERGLDKLTEIAQEIHSGAAIFNPLIPPGTIQPTVYHFSDLITCNSVSKGQQMQIDNSNTGTFGGTISGTGANFCNAICDGTNWLCH